MKIKRIIGGSLESNCYVIRTGDGNDCFIIDPGYNPKKIAEYVQKEGLNGKGIILTHHHHDHVGGASKLSEILACPVMMHEIDRYLYKGKVHRILKDGDILDLNGEILDIIHTPGHTAGSICIRSEKSKVIFTGDTIFDTDLGRTDLMDGSPSDMVDTCRMIIDKWSNEYTIYPGHDGSATMKQVRIYNEEFLACLEVKR